MMPKTIGTGAKREESPSKFLGFMREQCRRGVSRIHLHHRTLGGNVAVDDWPIAPSEKPEDLAERVWRRALDDAEQSGEGGMSRYGVVATREGGEAARWNLQTPALTAADGGAVEQPTPEGAIALTMRHLREERGVTSHLLLESIESLHNTHADQQTVWRSIIDAVVKAYEATVTQLRTQLEHADKMTERLLAQVDRQQERQLEWGVLREDLESAKHERELEMEKMRRSEGRKTQLIDELVIKRVVPALAAKFGSFGLPVPPAAADVAAAPPSPPPAFTPTVAAAIGAFLRTLGGPELLAIDAALTGEPKQRFAELVQAFIAEGEAAHNANAPANGGGAPSATAS